MRWLGCLCAGLLLVAGCEKKQVVVKEKTTRVHTGKLEKRTFQQRIPLQGTVQPVEFATISAKISGTLEMLNVAEGDVLKKGDLLFGIDRQVLKNQVVVKEDEIKVRQAALKSAEISLNIAKISLDTAQISFDQAKRDHERAQNLSKNKAISESSVEAAETDFRKAKMAVDTAHAEIATATANISNAQAQLKQAQSNLEIARKNLNDSTISAPFDCVVFETFVEENEYVSVGKPILKLENHRALEVVCYISAVYYDQIVVNKTAVDFTGKDGKAFARSVITYKAPGIDPESRTFKIKIAVPESANLVSGMLCELNVILTEREGYGLPESAVLLRAENRMIAYIVDSDNRAKERKIQRGIVDGGYSEILNAGEFPDARFVVAGQTFINNGSLLVEAGKTENK